MPSERGEVPAYRRDVQGLRALAVVLVVLDHARVGPFHGGYVGVDVFFVVSGFLITGLLLAEALRTGRVSLLGFYARRARRILPAATLVVVTTVVASLVLLSAVRAQDVVQDALWATFFAANVKLARDGTDYFHADAAPSPLQHFWSLAVEEQFYVVWPLLVLLACLVAARLARRPGRAGSPGRPAPVAPVVPVVASVLVLVVGASLAWSVLEAGRDAVGGYFSPFTRAWELGAGALVACWAGGRGRPAPAPVLSGVVGWAGLAAVLAASVAYDADTVVPGTAALLPVLGTVALLVGGRPAGGRPPVGWGAQRLLELAPVRAVGDWSYSVYLWHWPALVLVAAVWRQPGGWSGLGLTVGVLALAAATHRWVEQPVRGARVLRRRRLGAVLLYPAGVLVTVPLLVGAGAVVHGEVSGGGPPITTASYGQSAGHVGPVLSRDPVVALVQASVEAARNGMAVPAHLEPSLLGLESDVPSLGACEYYLIGTARPLCPRGDADGSRTLVLIGDSHARQWIPALEPLAARSGYRAYYLVREGCPAADVTPWKAGGGPNLDCQHFQNWARAEVARLHPDLVLLASDANQRGFADADGHRVDGRSSLAALFRAGMEREIDDVSAYAARVAVIGDPPEVTLRPGDCLSTRGATLAGCLSPESRDSLVFIDAVRQAARARHADYVDTGSWFCWQGVCPSVVGRFLPHRDRGHVSQPYAAYLAPALGRRLGLATLVPGAA